MPRTFNGTSDKDAMALGAAGSFTYGPGTIAAIVKSSSDAASGSPIHVGATASSTSRYNIQVAASVLKGRTRNTLASAPTITVTIANGWCLIAMTKATGTVVPRFHKVVLSSGAATHENSVTSLANPDAIAAAPQIAAGEGFFAGDVLVGGVWDRVLTDSEIERLAVSLGAWVSSSPRIGWRFDQAATSQKVTDWTGGGANEATLTGTSIATASVPILGYGTAVAEVTHPAAGNTNFTQTLAVTNTPATTRAATAAATKLVTTTPTAGRALSASAVKAASTVATATRALTVSAVKPVTLTPTAAKTATAAAVRAATATSTASLARAVSATRTATSTASTSITRLVSAARNADVEATATRSAATTATHPVETQATAARQTAVDRTLPVTLGSTATIARAVSAARPVTNTITAALGRVAAAVRAATVSSTASIDSDVTTPDIIPGAVTAYAADPARATAADQGSVTPATRGSAA